MNRVCTYGFEKCHLGCAGACACPNRDSDGTATAALCEDIVEKRND